jgi:two-component system phosphate regulon sensor histidine kinase PhoR
MAIQERRTEPSPHPSLRGERSEGLGLVRRFVHARGALVVAAVVFALLVHFAGLAPMSAALGFAAIALAVLTREATRPLAGEAALYGRDKRPAISDRAVEAIVSGLADPAIALTPDGLVVAFNASMQHITPGILRGEPISFALRVPDVLEAVRAAAASREPRRTEFFQRVPTDRWWEANIAPVVLPGDPPNRDRHLVLLTLRDLTPLRRIEEMRADFVANASHELRTPLASLSGFIETLQGPARYDEPSRDRFLAIMKEQATRMARLIDDLLSLSRIEQKAHIHPDLPIDVVSIVHEVADGLSPLADEREVEIRIADEAGSLIVSGDRDELIRVFENLIENALKYGAPGKRVDLALSHGGVGGEGDAIVSVRDYGPGIAPEHLPRLTERFYRVDIGESRAQGGTGLGLALVKHILNRHRGRLAIESTPGAGANFIVRLPLSRAASHKITK